MDDITTRQYAASNPITVPTVSADTNRLYAAGFSNGGGMIWQRLNSDLSSRFQGFAAVGKAMGPEQADHTFRPPFTQQEKELGTT